MAVAVDPALPPGVRQIRLVRPIQRFIRTEAAGGIVLLVGAIAALIWVNSPWSQSYHDLFEHHLAFDLGFFSVDEPLHFWINDAAMVIFFFVVGMEIKREVVVGELASVRRMVVPAAAAAGGMIVPVLIFFALASGDARDGWAIPMATDIAFAVGVLVLVGPRIPTGLKVLLLAMAIVDDLGAIAVIAVFYTETIDYGALGIVVALLAAGLHAQSVWHVVRADLLHHRWLRLDGDAAVRRTRDDRWCVAGPDDAVAELASSRGLPDDCRAGARSAASACR